jgi:hypothetical protein
MQRYLSLIFLPHRMTAIYDPRNANTLLKNFSHGETPGKEMLATSGGDIAR